MLLYGLHEFSEGVPIKIVLRDSCVRQSEPCHCLLDCCVAVLTADRVLPPKDAGKKLKKPLVVTI